MERLIDQYNIRDHEISLPEPSSRELQSERELALSVLRFLKNSAGGERIVASSEILEQFAGYFEKKITLGGTSVRAAIAMRTLGYTSALHLITTNEHVRCLIPQDSPYVCGNQQDALYPHLIVQFDQGTQVRAGDIHISTHRANRLIYHSDPENIDMALNVDFGALITHAEILLISGFNAMKSRDLLAERLGTLLNILSKLPRTALIFYEDAGFYDPSFSTLIYTTLGQHIDIVSMNEDELQAYLGRRVDILDASQVQAALADLHQIIPVPRLVVHSMYWALAYGERATDLHNALKGGVTMATTRFRYGDDFTAENYWAIASLPPNPQGARFAEEIHQALGEYVCCVPVPLVEQDNATTVGLGDAFVGGFLPALLPSKARNRHH
jgi:ADP-dependent phosphofructokinase/glucokinase